MKKKAEKGADWPARVYIERHNEDGGLYYTAHTELAGIDHDTKIMVFVPINGYLETVKVSTTIKERE